MEANGGKLIPRRRGARALPVDFLVDARLDAAQGLVWDDRTYRLYWIDSPASRLFSVSLTSGVVQSWTLPCPVGAIALCDDGRLLAMLLDGFYLFGPATQDLHFFAGLDQPWSSDCMHGEVGPDGAFWISGIWSGAIGSFMRLAPDGRGDMVDASAPSDPGAGIDRATMKGADLATGAQRAAVGQGAMDVEGAYWRCDHINGCVGRFSPDSQLLQRVALPVPAPTTCCFGGAAMNLLFVGSRRIVSGSTPLGRRPASGGIMMVALDVSGVRQPRFRPHPR